MNSAALKSCKDPEEVLGPWHPLVDQLGSSEGLLPLAMAAATLQFPRIASLSDLELFLEHYQAQVVISLDWPAILRGYRHACRNETRELVACDRHLAGQIRMPDLVRASQRAGQSQLQRLRPLRDHRLLQRYLRAVEDGQAFAWHTLVYGISLSIYSLPVLQGLILYERQTLRGFVNTAARHLNLSHVECRTVLGRLCSDLPQRLDALSQDRDWVVHSDRQG